MLDNIIFNKSHKYMLKSIDENMPQDYYKNRDFYLFASENNKFMKLAKLSAIKYSLTPNYPIGIIIVSEDGEIISESGNGNGYHEKFFNSEGHIKGCKRKFLKSKKEKEGKSVDTEEFDYDLCLGCHTDYHAEARAIRECKDKNKLSGASVYMYGHYWCCRSCWNKMKDVDIKQVFLLENCEKFKNKENIKEWADYVSSERLRLGIKVPEIAI